MKRIAALTAATALALAGAAVTGTSASADEHIPDHGHALLLGVDLDLSGPAPVVLGVRKCVDLAGNRAVPLHAHHDNLHFNQGGTAAAKLFTRAGHVVAPVAPFPGPPWTDCASLLATFGL